MYGILCIKMHVSSTFYNLDAAKDCLRETGGLQFILSLVKSSTVAEIKEPGLYTLGCAIERNGKYFEFWCTSQKSNWRNINYKFEYDTIFQHFNFKGRSKSMVL